jgi:hypothetical protein
MWVSAQEASGILEVAQWPEVDHEELLRTCPGGLFVLRLARDTSTARSWAARAAAVRDQADVGALARIQVRGRLEANGTLPLVATVCGYPVLTAQLVDLMSVSPRRIRLELAEPDPSATWVGLLRGRRLLTGPGPSWLLLGVEPGLGGAPRAREHPLSPGASRETMWTRWT